MSEVSGPGPSPSAPTPAPNRPTSTPPSPPPAPAQPTSSEPRDSSNLTPPAQEKPPATTDAHVAGLNSTFARPAQPRPLQERTQAALDSGNVEQQREIARELLEKQKRGERLSPEELQAARLIHERPMAVEAALRGSRTREENGQQITESRRIGVRSGDPHRPNGMVNEREVATERNYQGTPRIPFLPNAGVTRESRETTDLSTGQRRTEDVERLEMGGRKRVGVDAELVTPRDGRPVHSSAGGNFSIHLPFFNVGVGAETRLSTADGLARRDAQRIAQRQRRLEQGDRIRETARLAAQD